MYGSTDCTVRDRDRPRPRTVPDGPGKIIFPLRTDLAGLRDGTGTWSRDGPGPMDPLEADGLGRTQFFETKKTKNLKFKQIFRKVIWGGHVMNRVYIIVVEIYNIS